MQNADAAAGHAEGYAHCSAVARRAVGQVRASIDLLGGGEGKGLAAADSRTAPRRLDGAPRWRRVAATAAYRPLQVRVARIREEELRRQPAGAQVEGSAHDLVGVRFCARPALPWSHVLVGVTTDS